MSFSLVQEVAVNAGGLTGASQTATFSAAPTEGQLVVIPFSVNNAGADFQVSLPGFTATIAQSDGAFRTIGMFHKVAGAAEPSSYTLTMTGSAVLTGVARVFSGTLGTVNARPVIHEAATVGSIGDTLTAAAGSAVVAFAYTSSTAGKSWNAGWSAPINPARQSSVYKVSAGGSETATMTLDGGATNNRLSFVMAEFAEASGPTLASVPATAFPGQSRTVSGSGFGLTQGAGGVTINGVAQTVTAWSDTSITFTTVQGNTKFGAGNNLAVTNDGAQTANGTIELIVEPGTGGYVDVVDPAVADSSSLAFGFEAAGGAPVATGDQCHYVFTGNPGDPTSMTVGPDTLVSALDQEGIVNVRFWDATDSTWGSFAALNATVPVVDTVKPVITILGDNPATVVVGGSYTDAGATASDDVDGDLGPVTGTGSVDTNTIGQYTITYPGAGVVDSAGNVADDATRIVNVVAEAPVDPPVIGEPSQRRVGYRNSSRSAVRNSVGLSIH